MAVVLVQGDRAVNPWGSLAPYRERTSLAFALRSPWEGVGFYNLWTGLCTLLIFSFSCNWTSEPLQWMKRWDGFPIARQPGAVTTVHIPPPAPRDLSVELRGTVDVKGLPAEMLDGGICSSLILNLEQTPTTFVMFPSLGGCCHVTHPHCIFPFFCPYKARTIHCLI